MNSQPVRGGSNGNELNVFRHFTAYKIMMIVIVMMMTTMVMMMVPSDPMTCARSGNVTPELIEPHIKPNRS